MIPETMQAVLLTGFRGPEKLEYRTEVPVPRPGEGEVLVKVGAAGIMGSERDGGVAQYVSVPAGNAHPVQSKVTDAELASFPVAYVTAERMLSRAGLDEGETILVTGASGGVGSALVQLFLRRGAKVIALAGTGKEKPLEELGVRVVTRQGEKLTARIREAAGDKPIDLAADVVGGGLFMDLLNLIRPGGRLVTAGAIAGPLIELDLRRVYLNHLTIVGSTMGARKEFKDVLGYIKAGEIRPLVARTYPLSEIREAQADFKEKGFLGKLVLVPD